MATESHSSEQHAGTGANIYLVVFGALAIFTLLSFVFNYAERAGWIGKDTSFTAILLVAIIKALLVATFFMHLKYDWGRLYFLIIPVLILGTLLVVVLLPDIVLAWNRFNFVPGL